MKQQDQQILNVITQENEEDGDIFLYGVIGQEPSKWYGSGDEDEDLTAIKIVRAIKMMEKKYKRINIRINGPGGFVSAGDPVITAMMESPAEIVTYNDGLAASMSANIWLAGKKREMAVNAKLMFHNAMGIAIGNAKEMRETANMLDKFDQAMVATLVAITGMDEEEAMEKFYNYSDNWMTRKDAEEIGLLTNKEEYESQSAPPSNLANMSYEQVMKHYSQQENKGTGLIEKIQQLWDSMRPAATIQQTNTEPPMDKNQLIQGISAGEITTNEVAEVLRQEGYTVQEPASPEEQQVSAIQNAMEELLQPLTDRLQQMEAQVEALGGQPAAVPETGGSEEDPQNQDQKPPVHPDVEAANEAIQAAFKSSGRLKFG